MGAPGGTMKAADWAEVRASRYSANEKREKRANINCCHRDARSAIVLFDDKRIQDALYSLSYERTLAAQNL